MKWGSERKKDINKEKESWKNKQMQEENVMKDDGESSLGPRWLLGAHLHRGAESSDILRTTKMAAADEGAFD